jgi:NAD(P)H-binding
MEMSFTVRRSRGFCTVCAHPVISAGCDVSLKQSGLDWTIVKPGHLTDAPGSGRVQVSRSLSRRADVPRDDVALVLLECLHAPNTIGVEFELFEGDVPAREAVRSL